MTAPDAAPAEASWRAAVAKVLKGAAAEMLVTHTRDGLAIEPLSPASDRAPGPWRDTRPPFGIVQRVDHPDPLEANALARLDGDNGATGLVLTFAGHPSARGFGLPGATADTLETVLDGIALDRTSLRLELAPGAGGGIAQALGALIQRQRLATEIVDIDFGLDPIGDLARSGRAFDPATLLHLAEQAHAAGFRARVVRADGRVHHEAGASEAQEVAAVLSAGVAALRALEPTELAQAAEAISFTLAADADFVLTIAKLRALRALWAQIEAACGLTPRPIRLHAETAWRMMARQDPWTNILRITIASAAAILGGADSLGVLPFTAALGLPDAFARRLARNTPLVLLEEAHLGRVADPAAGAGSLDALTDALSREAWRIFQALERDGGIVAALQEGRWQRDVAATRETRQAELASGAQPIVGVTAFGHPTGTAPLVLMPSATEASAAFDPKGLPSARDAGAFEHEPTDESRGQP